MASTRNINTKGNYCLENKMYKEGENYTTYKYSAYGYAYNPQLPGVGLLSGHMPNTNLSHNPWDIESFLFGIGSTDLVNPKPPLCPQLKTLSSANIYKPADTYLPEPLIVSGNNRPFPIP